MKDFKDYSLPEIFNAPSPIEPGRIQWKSVAIYGAISVSCVIVFGVIMHYSIRSNTRAIIEMQEKLNVNLKKYSLEERRADS